MFGFKKKQGPTIGVEINSDSISLMQLEKTRVGIEVIRFACLPAPANTVREGLVTDPQAVGAVIMSLLEDSGIPASGPMPTMNISIPAQSAVIRLMPVPTGMPPDELAEVVTQEATNHVPFPINDANLDWSLMPATERTDPDGVRRVDVILAAVQRSIIETCWRTADSAGVRLGRVEVSSLSAIRGLALSGHDSPDKVSMVVNIRQDATDINIVRSAMPLFGRSVIIGIETLTEAVSRSLEVDFDQALDLLPEISLFGRPPKDDRSGQAAQVARTIFSDITDELERSLEFYESQVGDVRVDEIILTGPGCMLQNLDQYVSSRMGHKAAYGNAMKELVFDQTLVVERMRPILASLVGSSVDPAWNPTFTVDLDLNKEGRLPHLFDERKTQVLDEDRELPPWFRPGLTAGAALLVLAFLSWSYLVYLDLPAKSQEAEGLSNKIVEAKHDLTKISSLKTTNTHLDTRRKVLTYLINKSRRWSPYLRVIAENTPRDVQIEQVFFNSDNFVLEGYGRDFASVSNLAINLDGNDLVSEARINFATRKEKTREVVTFSLTADTDRVKLSSRSTEASH